MPTFDIVSEVDDHELTNAVDQAKRELSQRFDFKGTKARIEHTERSIALVGEAEFQCRQILEILQAKFIKRGLDIDCMEFGEISTNVAEARQPITVREGIDADLGRKIIKLIKASKLKVQTQMQDQQLRVSGKNRDDLQNVIALVKDAKLDFPLQFKNFRD